MPSFSSSSGSLDQLSDAQAGAVTAVFVVMWIVWLIFYIYMALCLQTMATKTSTANGWFAWIPLLNLYLMCQIASRPGWFMLLFFVPFVNLIAFIMVWMGMAQACGKPSWLGILMVLPLANIIIPGYLAFREWPLIQKCLESLSESPDVLICDGQGIAHFRRMGIATHMGIVLNKPTIGCAKSRLIGCYEEPGEDVGSYSPLIDGEETVGVVLRTRKRVRPVFSRTSLRPCSKSAVKS